MRNLLKYTLTLLSFVMLYNCTPQVGNTTIEKTRFVEFTNDKNIDKKGYPTKVTTLYFPENIFIDTATAKIDTSLIRSLSYFLFKMNEPCLSSHYLGKDVYRVTAFRSFHNPIVVRIEKEDNNIQLIAKELNLNVYYHFDGYPHSYIRFVPPGVKIEEPDEKALEVARAHTDSIIAQYKKTNEHLSMNLQKELTQSEWHNLEANVDSANFWKTDPDLNRDQDGTYTDGSTWILEGHTKQGYQIKRIHNPRFEQSESHSSQYLYSDIFRTMIEYTDIKDVKLY